MESLTSLFQCHLELQSGSLLYVSSMELPLPAPGLPKPSHCWFSWNWDNHLALSSWCLHELLHDLTSPTVPILLFPTSGEVPRGQTDALQFSLCKTLSSSERGLLLAESSPWREENSQIRSLFAWWEVRFPWWQLWKGCVCSTARSHGFHPQLRIQLLPSAPQRWWQKRALPASSQRVWTHVCPHSLLLYSSPAEVAVHSPSPCPWSSHCAARAFLPQNIPDLGLPAVPHSLPLLDVLGFIPGAVMRESPLDLGVPTGAGSTLGEGREGRSIPRIWAFTWEIWTISIADSTGWL